MHPNSNFRSCLKIEAENMQFKSSVDLTAHECPFRIKLEDKIAVGSFLLRSSDSCSNV